MGGTLTHHSATMNFNKCMTVYDTFFPFVFLGVAQLTLGRSVSVSLACPVGWLVNLCLHCQMPFSHFLCVSLIVFSNQFVWLWSQLQPCLLLSVFISSIVVLFSSPSRSEIYLKRKNLSVFHQHEVTTFSFYQRSMHICPWKSLLTELQYLRDKWLPSKSSYFENEFSYHLLPNWSKADYTHAVAQLWHPPANNAYSCCSSSCLFSFKLNQCKYNSILTCKLHCNLFCSCCTCLIVLFCFFFNIFCLPVQLVLLNI